MARTPVSRWAFVDPCMRRGETQNGPADSEGATMKAVRLHKEGGPEQLVYEDAPKPQVGAGDALIRVHATGITPAELTYAETYRNCDGSDRLPAIPGHEVSGVVESVAHGVTDVSIGDEVFALTSFCRDGAAAEYVAVHAADLAPKPKTLNLVQAAAVPLSALTVWQAFFDHARLAPGHQRVLIHGGAGGVGAFAVQTARWHGAYVIGTASAENRDFLLDLGANEVIDYQHEGAVLIAGDGRTVTDRVEISAELERDLSLGLPLEAKARHVFVNGDIAQIVMDWSIDGTGPDGKHVHVEGTASDVARRGADGLWRYLIDNRLGTAVRQPA